MTLVDTLEFAQGLRASIYHDPDVEGPNSCDDALRIVILHGRYLDPSDGACGSDPGEVAAWERKNEAQWFSIPLFLYDHSGTVYRVGHSNPFHCPWDSGRVGIIALKRSEWGSGTESDDKLTEYAAAIAAEYTSWANGECYGYVLSDAAGHEIESCWGFIGMDTVREQAAAAAQSHS